MQTIFSTFIQILALAAFLVSCSETKFEGAGKATHVLDADANPPETPIEDEPEEEIVEEPTTEEACTEDCQEEAAVIPCPSNICDQDGPDIVAVQTLKIKLPKAIRDLGVSVDILKDDDGEKIGNCSSTSCTLTLPEGEKLRARFDAESLQGLSSEWEFESWSENCALTGGAHHECELVVNDATEIEPRFTPLNTVTIAKGNITSSFEGAISMLDANRQPIGDCDGTQTCTATAAVGSTLYVQAEPTLQSSGSSWTFEKWIGGCTSTGGPNNECSLTISAETGEIESIQAQYKTSVVGTTSTSNLTDSFLRNAPQINAQGTRPIYPQLPPGSYRYNNWEAVFIHNDSTSRNKVCEAVLPGSTVESFSTGQPTYSGWTKNGTSYWNLFIGRWGGSTWQRLCSGGTDCLYKALTFVNRIECVKRGT